MYEPWGKLDRSAPDAAEAPRLSLIGHCVDVGAVMAALLALPSLRSRLAELAGRPLIDRDVERLVALAFLHDIGKNGAGFQSRGLSEAVRTSWQDRARADRRQMGHVMVVAPLFCGDQSYEPWRAALAVDRILACGGDSPSARMRLCDLWLAAISHHGEPVTHDALDRQASGFEATWKQPVGGFEPLRGLTAMGEAARSLFPDAFADEPMAPFAPGLTHAFAGLVSLADWIGSNTQPEFFPYTLDQRQTVARWPVARERARRVLRRMHIDPDVARADLRQRAPSFEQVFGFAPRDAQRQASAWDDGDEATGRVVVLEAETGSGKTEAALWRFKALFEAGAVDALCFLLPTRVAATGVYARLNRFVDALFPDPDRRPPTVLAVPGYLRANGDEGRRALSGFEVLWPDGDDAKDRPLYWAAENSKRYFAGSAVAATIDQFLLSTLQVKHAHLRGSLALRALVVVDEVHASDAYMTALLREALERHVLAGGHALLMSATLTGDTRERLLRVGVRRGAVLAGGTLAAPDAPYPAVSTRAGVRACAGTGRDNRVQVVLHPSMRDAASVAALAAAEVARGARVLVLRNTVRQAVATQRALEEQLVAGHPALFDVDGVSAMHHGRYAFEDRQRLDRRVEVLFGKDAAAAREARVLTGTQTREISVDCDSDVMITDIAPIDVLLQRLGRLHRHAERDRFRPAAAAAPRVVVLTPPGRDLGPLLSPGASRGLGIGPRSAYENLLAIEAAWQLLEVAAKRGWCLPQENRRLVEAGAGVESLARIAESLGSPWPAHFKDVYGKESAQAGQALPLMVSWRKAWGEGGWSELGDQARTRLGLDNVDIDLLRPWQTPLGAEVRRLSVPAWMLRGSLPATVVAQVAAGDELRLTVGTTDLVYGRLGLSAA